MVEELEARVERLEQGQAQILAELTRIRRLYDKAYSFLEEHPDVALNQARKTAEALCKQVYIAEGLGKGGRPANSYSLDELIGLLLKQKAIPKSIEIPLRTIQSFGNFGTHDQGPDSDRITTAYAEPCLRALAITVDWYLERYGTADEIGEPVAEAATNEAHAFQDQKDEPQPPEEQTTDKGNHPAEDVDYLVHQLNEAAAASIQARGLAPLPHPGIHINCPHCHQRFYTEELLEEDDWVEISCRSCGRDFTCDPEGGLYGTTLSCPQCNTSFYSEALDADECGEVTCPAPGCGEVFNVDEQEPVGIYVTCPFCWEDFYDEGFGGRPACFHCEEEFTTDGNGKATGGHVECPECGEKWWEDNEEEEYGLFPQHCSACGRRFHVEIKPPNRRGQGDGT